MMFRSRQWLLVIAREATQHTGLEEYVVRAEAWASTESQPPSDTAIAKAWTYLHPGRREFSTKAERERALVHLIADARARRVRATAARFRTYINSKESQ